MIIFSKFDIIFLHEYARKIEVKKFHIRYRTGERLVRKDSSHFKCFHYKQMRWLERKSIFSKLDLRVCNLFWLYLTLAVCEGCNKNSCPGKWKILAF